MNGLAGLWRAPAPWLAVLVFAVQVVCTLLMLGLILFVQLVHYPLFRRVPEGVFAAFEAEHARRTGWVAAPLMIGELGSSLLLLNRHLALSGISRASAQWGAGLALLTWVVTFAVQVPLHNRLHRGFDRGSVERLVRSNWVRTGLWTARAGLVMWWVLRGRAGVV